jgi:hypothetical protein
MQKVVTPVKIGVQPFWSYPKDTGFPLSPE